jgi:hypothetical protein
MSFELYWMAIAACLPVCFGFYFLGDGFWIRGVGGFNFFGGAHASLYPLPLAPIGNKKSFSAKGEVSPRQ